MLEGTHLFEETLDARRISFEPPEAEQSYASSALCHYSYRVLACQPIAAHFVDFPPRL